MSRSVKFWLAVAIANLLAAWLLEVPIWILPVVAVVYVLVLLGIDRWQKSPR